MQNIIAMEGLNATSEKGVSLDELVYKTSELEKLLTEVVSEQRYRRSKPSTRLSLIWRTRCFNRFRLSGDIPREPSRKNR